MKKLLIFKLLVVMFTAIAFTSCSKDDDSDDSKKNQKEPENQKTTIEITVTGIQKKDGIQVYMFQSTSGFISGYDRNKAFKSTTTNQNGIATFEFQNDDFSGNYADFDFVIYDKENTAKKIHETVWKGKTNSATFDISSYSNTTEINTKGVLTMSNNTSVNYLIMVDGEQIGTLKIGGKWTLNDLELNREYEISIYESNLEEKTYNTRTQVTKNFKFTKSGETQKYEFPDVARVNIIHKSTSKYYVYIDDVTIDCWTEAKEYTYNVSANTSHTLEVVQKDGYIFSPTKGKKTFKLKEGDDIYFSGPVSSTSTEYFN